MPNHDTILLGQPTEALPGTEAKVILKPGCRVGRWTLLKKGQPSGAHSKWICKCDCGNRKSVFSTNLKRQLSTSCGCATLEASRTHQMSQDRLYRVWNAMIGRCHRPSDRGYKNYGARGIYVCERWRNSFEAFLEDMGYRPFTEAQLERVDNDGPYSPDNCIWATKEVQCRNTRRTVFLKHDGRCHRLDEWSEITGICVGTIRSRLQRGWSVEKTLTTSVANTGRRLALPEKKRVELKRQARLRTDTGNIAQEFGVSRSYVNVLRRSQAE